MSRCLKSYFWAEEPLIIDGSCDDEEIVVRCSDKEKSHSTKEERKRRREAIGRRYLLGHAPFIESASLRGPFGRKIGWINPWEHVHPFEEPQRSQGRTQIEDRKALDSRPAFEAESETLPAEIGFVYARERSGSDTRHDVSMCGAQNEPDEEVLEQMCEAIRQEHEQSKTSDNREALPTSLYASDNLRPSDRVNGTLDLPLDGTNLPVDGSSANSLREETHPPIKHFCKRKADKSWLKSTNILKRSRHEVLQDSSPTPAEGTQRNSIQQAYRESSVQPADPETLQRQNHLMLPDANHAIRGIQTTNERSVIPGAVQGYDYRDRSGLLAIKREGRRDWVRPASEGDGKSTKSNTADCRLTGAPPNELHACLVGRRIQSLPTHTPSQQHLDVMELSPSDLGIENNATLSVVRQICQETKVEDETIMDDRLYQDKAGTMQDVSVSKIGPTTHRKSIARTTLSPESPSHDSEGSFQYRRTNRTENKKRLSTRERRISAPTRKCSPAPPTILHLQSPEKPTNCSVSSNNNTDATNLNTGCDEKRLHQKKYYISRDWGGSVDINSGVGDETISISSPDQLCEDFIVDLQLQVAFSDSGEAEQFDKFPESWKDIREEQRVRISQPIPGPGQEFKELFTSYQGSQFSLEQALLYETSKDIADPSTTALTVVRRRSSDPPDAIIALSTESKTPDDFPQANRLPAASDAQTVTGDNLATPSPRNLIGKITSSRNQAAKTPVTPVQNYWPETKQSPWMAVNSRNPLPAFARRIGSQDLLDREDKGNADICDEEKTIVRFSTPRIGEAAARSGPLAHHLAQFSSPVKHLHEQEDGMGYLLDPMTSTQIFVEAATVNPWGSAFKKPRKQRSGKRVSFGPLPTEIGDDTAISSYETPIEPMKSLGPASVILNSTHRDMKVTGQPFTKSMNAVAGNVTSMRLQSKPSQSSPAIDAMAEAFVNADRQTLHQNFGFLQNPNPVKLDAYPAEFMDTSANVEGWIAQEDQEHQSSSPMDASFSIAPSGKVTSVSIETPCFGGEDNLDAVIEDMGSFLEGWDVDSEIKKVKGYRSEKGNGMEGQRMRGYLSGVSNR